jgi:hypothetical protein
VVLRGELRLRFQPDAVPEDVTGLVVRLNGEVLERFERRALLDAETTRLLRLDEGAISGNDRIELALECSDPCTPLERGAWQLVAGGELETVGLPLPLPSTLEMLPISFVDEHLEREPELVVALPDGRPDLVEAAAVAVAGFARRMHARLRVQVQSTLPEGYAVALVDDAAAAARLGVPFHAQPTAEIVDRAAGGKALVLSGEGAARVRAAAAGLFSSSDVEGRRASFEPGVDAPASSEAPSRWLDPSEPLTLERIVGGDLVHRGTRSGILKASFRVTPDLFGWPQPTFLLRLDYRRVAGPDTPPLDLDVELNGQQVTTVRISDRSGTPQEARLWIPRESLHGFNQLVLHVHHEGVDACSSFEDAGAELVVLGSSALHLEGFERFVALPDIELFAFDGFPFSRAGHLSETAALLPPEPEPEEVASLLSVIAHLADITGDLPLGLEVRADPTPPAALDRDLLVVGAFDRHPALTAWSARSPVTFVFGGGRVKAPVGDGLWGAARLLGFDSGELERARAVLGAYRRVAVLAGFPSPIAPGRSVVALTAGRPQDLVGLDAFTGYAEAQRPGGDLLIVAVDGAVRSRHQLGLTRNVGQLPVWTRIRWEAATSWVAVGPLFLVSVLLIAGPTLRSLDRRCERRARPWGDPRG